MYDLSNTVIGADYLKYKAHGRPIPPVDCFLDFMNKVKELKNAEAYPADWYDREIEATKYILRMETSSC
jgi:hypothetical protein